MVTSPRLTPNVMDRDAHIIAIAAAKEVADFERQRLIGLAIAAQSNPQSGSSGGDVGSISLEITGQARVRFSSSTFQFGVPNFVQEVEDSMNAVGASYFAALAEQVTQKIGRDSGLAGGSARLFYQLQQSSQRSISVTLSRL